MASVQALVLEAPRTLRRRSFPRPEVGDDDALLRIEACGLCGTDHEQYSGVLFGGFAFVPGHESVGVIDEIGDRAAARWGVDRGDRVAVEVFQSCRSCDACRAGAYRRCVEHGIGDMYGFIPVDREPGLWGGYAEYQYLGPDAMVLPVPLDLDPVVATLFNPLGAGIRWATTLPGTEPGDRVAVLGPGIRGLASLVAARAAGAELVMVTGHGERDRARLDLARRLGADLVVDVAVDDARRRWTEAVGEGPDVVVDVTAKAPAALGQAVDLVRPGGTVILAGTRGSSETPGFSPDLVVLKEVRLVGALGVDVDAYRAAIDLLAAPDQVFADVPRQVVGLDGLEDLLRTMAGETADAPPVHGVLVPA